MLVEATFVTEMLREYADSVGIESVDRNRIVIYT